MPDIEAATPEREITPTDNNYCEGVAPVSDEGYVSKESTSAEHVTEMRAPPDPNLVDWEGIDDPEHPANWPSWKKALNITIILMTYVTR